MIVIFCSGIISSLWIRFENPIFSCTFACHNFRSMNTQYKNQPSIVLENEILRAEFLPNTGGKLVSLIGKRTGYEYLVQRPNTIYREQPFAGVYVDGECSGFDDMFPTIDACLCENAPWQGVELADHGEVWSLPWDVTFAETNAVTMAVHGVRFPYRLEKRIRLTENTLLPSGGRPGGGLQYHYALRNLSPFDFDYLWAGHLMINLEEGAKVNVPDDCTEMVTVLSNSGLNFGDVHRWPYLKDATGATYRADRVRSKESKGFEKYYFTHPLKQGWCGIEYPSQQKKLQISFSAENVPYLGILMNEGGWDNLYNIIIEPCSVCFDRPDVAKKQGQCSVLRGKSTVEWMMEISIE